MAEPRTSVKLLLLACCRLMTAFPLTKKEFHIPSSWLGPGRAGTTSRKVKYLFQSKFNPKNKICTYDANQGLAIRHAQRPMLQHQLLREEKAFTCESTTGRWEAGGEAQIRLPDPGSRRGVNKVAVKGSQVLRVSGVSQPLLIRTQSKV